MKNTTINTLKLTRAVICSDCKISCTDEKKARCNEAFLKYSINKTIYEDMIITINKLNLRSNILN